VNSPENLDVRKINSISRVSKIPLILEAKWGGEILNTIGFYPSKAHWFLPTSAPMDLVVYGNNLQIPNSPETVEDQSSTWSPRAVNVYDNVPFALKSPYLGSVNVIF
jgi:hypothetical protein